MHTIKDIRIKLIIGVSKILISYAIAMWQAVCQALSISPTLYVSFYRESLQLLPRWLHCPISFPSSGSFLQQNFLFHQFALGTQEFCLPPKAGHCGAADLKFSGTCAKLPFGRSPLAFIPRSIETMLHC